MSAEPCLIEQMVSQASSIQLLQLIAWGSTAVAAGCALYSIRLNIKAAERSNNHQYFEKLVFSPACKEIDKFNRNTDKLVSDAIIKINQAKSKGEPEVAFELNKNLISDWKKQYRSLRGVVTFHVSLWECEKLSNDITTALQDMEDKVMGDLERIFMCDQIDTWERHSPLAREMLIILRRNDPLTIDKSQC